MGSGIVYVLEAIPREVRIVESREGKRPFSEWLARLDPQTRGSVNLRLRKVENGNLGDVKSCGSGVFEFRFNDGCRVYFAQSLSQIFLLGGGTKHQQQRDIDSAIRFWSENAN
jgi:putative addiction module killer protein